MTKHTPGPWMILEYLSDQQSRDVHDKDGNVVASCWMCAPFSNDESIDGRATHEELAKGAREANAQLIAAAPELLEALQSIIEIGKRDMSNPKYDEYFKSAKEAIAKATGGTI